MDMLLCGTLNKTVAFRLDFKSMDVVGLYDFSQCPLLAKNLPFRQWNFCPQYPGLMMGLGQSCLAVAWREDRLECQEVSSEPVLDASFSVDTNGLVHAIFVMEDGSVRQQALVESKAKGVFSCSFVSFLSHPILIVWFS